MRIALGVVLIVVGLALFPYGYRLHKRHPEWAWNVNPAVWLYVLGGLLAVLGIGLTLRR